MNFIKRAGLSLKSLNVRQEAPGFIRGEEWLEFLSKWR